MLHHWILGHVFTRWSSYLPNVHGLKAYDLLLINHFAGLRLSNFWLSLAIQWHAILVKQDVHYRAWASFELHQFDVVAHQSSLHIPFEPLARPD